MPHGGLPRIGSTGSEARSMAESGQSDRSEHGARSGDGADSGDGAGSGQAKQGGTDPHRRGPLATGSPGTAALGDRIDHALRQGALMAVALLVAAQVTERLRPDELPDRGILDTPFLWAIVTWVAVLLFHAVAFEQSQIRSIEREPLTVAGAVAGLHLVVGIITLDGGSFGRRLVYLASNSLGALVFWWAVFSFAALLLRLMGRQPAPGRGT